MPSNLNALIRYKQIDLCLRNKYLNATIEIMQEKCSEQLLEHRGIYKLVSERTIRDDIRIMSSDALGFNAPIIVKDGIYSYTDKEYSIFNTSIHEIELMKRILNLLVKERNNIKNERLDSVLKDLSNLTGIAIESVKSDLVIEKDFHIEETEEIIEPIKTRYQKSRLHKLEDETIDLSNFYKPKILKQKVMEELYNWESVLNLI